MDLKKLSKMEDTTMEKKGSFFFNKREKEKTNGM